jgi:hypothetical protein
MDDSIKYNPEKNSIKIWPYLNDMSQAIIPYSNNHLSQNKEMVVNLDFSAVKGINSSGAAITLMKLISILPKQSKFRIVIPKGKNIEKFLQDSGLFAILNKNFHIIKTDLFNNIEIQPKQTPHIILDEKQGIEKISFPIFHLRYDENKDRVSVDEFSDWITDIVIDYLAKYNFQKNTLLSVLKEIAKNSQDHTKVDAYFGFDIIKNLNSNTGELSFSFSDLGIGITKNVKDNLPEDSNYIRAKGKFSYSDAYHFAFTLGNTTSKNPRNKGIGMSMIMDGVRLLNLDLTIWDGRSMLFVPEKISHSELRRNVFDTGNLVGFYYYGRLKF